MNNTTSKRAPGRPKKPITSASIKTSISLSDVIYGWAIMQAKDMGYDNNFSAYVAELIRKDKLAADERKARMGLNPDRGN